MFEIIRKFKTNHGGEGCGWRWSFGGSGRGGEGGGDGDGVCGCVGGIGGKCVVGRRVGGVVHVGKSCYFGSSAP